MSFLFNRSVGGPDEDWTGREVTVTNPESGEVVGKATLVEQIPFAAAYSQIYKCFFSGGPLDGQLVCAKVLTTGNSHTAVRAEPLLKRLYDRELTALTKVKHKHVIGLVGIGELTFQQHDTAPTSPSNLGAMSRGSSGQQACVDLSMVNFTDQASSPRALGTVNSGVGVPGSTSMQDRGSVRDRVSQLSNLSPSLSVGDASSPVAGGHNSLQSSHTEPARPVRGSGSGTSSVPLPSRFSAAVQDTPLLSRFSAAAQDGPLPSRFSAAAQDCRASSGGSERVTSDVTTQRKPQLSASQVPEHGAMARTTVARSAAATGSVSGLDSPLRRSFQRQMLAATHTAASPFATSAAAMAASTASQAAAQSSSAGPQQQEPPASPTPSTPTGEGATLADGHDHLVASRQSSSYIPYVSPSVLFGKQPSGGGSFLNANRSVFGMPHRPIPSLTFMRRSTSMAEQASPMRRVLFLEWMPGGDARALIDHARQPMEEQAAATILLPITQALAAAHEEGVVHRDVKAANILLAPGLGEVRLADWGISVHESESGSRMSGSGANSMATMPGTIGTQYWCAPELELGHAHGTQSDIFSLAITFIELVTGRDPKYDNQSEAGYNLLVDAQRGILPHDMSQAALSWLMPCLSYNPSQRLTAQQLLQHSYFTAARQQLELQAQRMAENSVESLEEALLKASRNPGASPDSYVNMSLALFTATDEQRGSEPGTQQVSTNLMTSNASLGSKQNLTALDGGGTIDRSSSKLSSQGVLGLAKKRTMSGLKDGPSGGKLEGVGIQAHCRVQAPLPVLPASDSHAVVGQHPEIMADPYLEDVPGINQKVPMCGCIIS